MGTAPLARSRDTFTPPRCPPAGGCRASTSPDSPGHGRTCRRYPGRCLRGSKGRHCACAPCGAVRADNFLPFARAHMAGQGKNVIVTHGQELKRRQGAGFGFQPEMQPSHWLMRVNHEDQCRALYARRVSLSEDPRSDCRSGESAGFWQAGPIPHGHASGLGKSRPPLEIDRDYGYNARLNCISIFLNLGRVNACYSREGK